MITKFEMFANRTRFTFEVGKKYRYDDLPKNIQREIDVQFDGGYDEEDDPMNYEWEFKYLKPDQTIEYLEGHFGEYSIDDALDDPYMKRIIRDIKQNGIKKPAVGTEGNHRALACWHLGIDLPYLEPHFSPIEENEEDDN